MPSLTSAGQRLFANVVPAQERYIAVSPLDRSLE
jgi:hypothetical protein